LSPTYTSAHLTPAPDLYGPFWTLTTLIFTLFVTSSLAHSIVSYLSSDPVEYDFALLSTAVGLVYSYGIGLPVLFWGALRYAGISEGWTMVEAVTVWGYAMFVWIPVSVRAPRDPVTRAPSERTLDYAQILCIVPIALLRWILCGIAFGLSGYFLVANVYPVLVSVCHPSLACSVIQFKLFFFSTQADQKSVRLMIVVVAVLHAVMALLFKVLFFSYYIDGNIGPSDPTGINTR